jgi:hypothetical protein
MQSALSAPNRSGQIGHTAASAPAVPPGGATLTKLFAPPWEKALAFLDDKLLLSTSKAVERGKRHYRKWQKSVYRVRTQAQIRVRLALDMWREAQAEGRQQTLTALHCAQAG